MKIDIYTDGSCSKNNVDNLNREDDGGFGYVILCDDVKVYESCGMFHNTTNNRMEMKAIIESLKYALKTYGPNHEYHVYTDSALIVNTFKQKWYKKWLSNGWKKADRTSVKNIDLWKELIHMNNNWILNGGVSVEKVKGHADVYYNQEADRLANVWRGSVDENFDIDQKPSSGNTGYSN